MLADERRVLDLFCAERTRFMLVSLSDVRRVRGPTVCARRGRSSPPALLDHRGLPSLTGCEHIVFGAEHLGSLEAAVDLQADLPAQMMCPQLADRGERRIAACLVTRNRSPR